MKPASDKQLKLIAKLYPEIDPRDLLDLDARQAFQMIEDKLGSPQQPLQSPSPVVQSITKPSFQATGDRNKSIERQCAFKGAIELAMAGKISIEQIEGFTNEFVRIIAGEPKK